METHHHAHTPRKKWTHYLWEFLMLFLAVFCGFLAENFREHQVEKNRGKQYMISLYEDLKTDTARLNEMIIYADDKIAGLNDMDACYDSITDNFLSSQCMAKLILHSRANRPFTITDRTITQLGNAGGFRILNKEDADSVMSYVNMYKGFEDFQATLYQTSQDNVRNTLNELGSFKSIRNLLKMPGFSYGSNITTLTPEMMPDGPILFSNDKPLINKWFNQLSVYLRITVRQRQQLQNFRDKAKGLIEYCKRKYHLK